MMSPSLLMAMASLPTKPGNGPRSTNCGLPPDVLQRYAVQCDAPLTTRPPTTCPESLMSFAFVAGPRSFRVPSNRNAREADGVPDFLETPATCPTLLMACAYDSVWPGRTPKSVAVPEF